MIKNKKGVAKKSIIAILSLSILILKSSNKRCPIFGAISSKKTT